MVPFDENQTLDHIADRGDFDAAMSRKLAYMIAATHENSERVATAPWLAAIGDYIGQNGVVFRERGDIFRATAAAELERNSRSALDRLTPLLLARGERGLTRRGHGDLQLGNIALIDNEPVAFDAIEFNPLVACGDVLYDLAFLLMDLIDRDLPAAANQVLNGYFSAVRRLADHDGLAAIPFFMSLRAAIRAKVTVARLDQAKEHDRQTIVASAQRYFQLACDALRPAKPKIVCVGGLSGTGKSLLARSLAPFIPPIPGALVLRSDVERKALFGRTEFQWLSPQAYTAAASKKLYDALNETSARIANAGYSVIVDAVFARPSERAGIAEIAQATRADLHGLFLAADLATRLKRIGGRTGDASDADAKVAREQESYVLGAMDWTIVDASGSPAQTLANARVLLRDPRLGNEEGCPLQ
jgi:predicted kinase